MKNIIKNNKGYMLVEIIVASAIALVMAYFLIDITIKLVDKNNDYYIDSVLLTDKNIITKEIMDDINSKKLVSVVVNDDHTQATLTYDDNTTKEIIIDKENKIIKYGNYTKKLSDEINLEEITLLNDNNILVINLPIYTNYSKEDYGIKLTLPYSADIEIVYPKIADLVIDNMPVPTGGYKVDTSSCNETSMTYDYAKKGFKVSNVSVAKNAKCTPTITKTTRTSFSTYIKKLLGTKTSITATNDPDNPDVSALEKITEYQVSSSMTLSAEDYRYRGPDPNNYVIFNDEIWRIIGVFDENTHGIKNTHLVKIIKNDHIGPYAWDIENNNDFTKSDMYKILTAYYNHQDATDDGYCFVTDHPTPGKDPLNNSVSVKCDFSIIGIQEEYKKMVNPDINWFLRGPSVNALKNMHKNKMYGYERKLGGISSYESTFDANIKVPVGLLYPSDFMYASSTKYENVAIEFWLNWLHLNMDEHTITLFDSEFGNDELLYIENTGRPIYFVTRSNFLIRPVLYLKQEVYYVSGTGTYTDPYIIAID